MRRELPWSRAASCSALFITWGLWLISLFQGRGLPDLWGLMGLSCPLTVLLSPKLWGRLDVDLKQGETPLALANKLSAWSSPTLFLRKLCFSPEETMTFLKTGFPDVSQHFKEFKFNTSHFIDFSLKSHMPLSRGNRISTFCIATRLLNTVNFFEKINQFL